MSKFTILIAGLLNKECLETIDYYTSIGPVVLQYWDHLDDAIINPYKNRSDITIVRNEQPDATSAYNNKAISDPPNNNICQFNGIRLGLNTCKTEYVIRTRSDESFTNLQPLLDCFLENPNRLVSSNIFWSRKYKHHIGDHLFVAKTNWLKEVYNNICQCINANPPIRPLGRLNPENILCYNFTQVSRKYHILNKEQEFLTDRFACIDVNELGDYSICLPHKKKRWSHKPFDKKASNSTIGINDPKDLENVRLLKDSVSI